MVKELVKFLEKKEVKKYMNLVLEFTEEQKNR